MKKNNTDAISALIKKGANVNIPAGMDQSTFIQPDMSGIIKTMIEKGLFNI